MFLILLLACGSPSDSTITTATGDASLVCTPDIYVRTGPCSEMPTYDASIEAIVSLQVANSPIGYVIDPDSDAVMATGTCDGATQNWSLSLIKIH